MLATPTSVNRPLHFDLYSTSHSKSSNHSSPQLCATPLKKKPHLSANPAVMVTLERMSRLLDLRQGTYIQQRLYTFTLHRPLSVPYFLPHWLPAPPIPVISLFQSWFLALTCAPILCPSLLSADTLQEDVMQRMLRQVERVRKDCEGLAYLLLHPDTTATSGTGQCVQTALFGRTVHDADSLSLRDLNIRYHAL